MKTIYLIILSVLVLCGCTRTEAERAAVTQHNAENPVKVCTMPDGRILYRITIDRNDYDHYVYFFSTNDTQTITVNRLVPSGKTRRNQTVILDGETYQLVPLEKQ